MRFEDFELDEKGFQLREHGKPVRLERIPMELLILLVRNRLRLVTRDEIFAQIWGVNHYLESESAINTAIRKLRKALRDDVANPRLIETVQGKGYRFTAATAPEAPGLNLTRPNLKPSDTSCAVDTIGTRRPPRVTRRLSNSSNRRLIATQPLRLHLSGWRTATCCRVSTD